MEMVRLRNVVLLQAVIVIYTFSSVLAKLASGQEVFSAGFVMFYLGELAVLGIYALLWQQMIKRFELSVAYTNRAMALLWSLVWAVVFFHEQVSIRQIVGVALVILGTVIVNGGVMEAGCIMRFYWRGCWRLLFHRCC